MTDTGKKTMMIRLKKKMRSMAKRMSKMALMRKMKRTRRLRVTARTIELFHFLK